MAAKKSPRKTQRPRINLSPCAFCKSKKVPDYKEYKDLSNFLSERARILGKSRTGICSRHQKMLGIAIKRARHLGLLPFSSRI